MELDPLLSLVLISGTIRKKLWMAHIAFLAALAVCVLLGTWLAVPRAIERVEGAFSPAGTLAAGLPSGGAGVELPVLRAAVYVQRACVLRDLSRVRQVRRSNCRRFPLRGLHRPRSSRPLCSRRCAELLCGSRGGSGGALETHIALLSQALPIKGTNLASHFRSPAGAS